MIKLAKILILININSWNICISIYNKKIIQTVINIIILLKKKMIFNLDLVLDRTLKNINQDIYLIDLN